MGAPTYLLWLDNVKVCDVISKILIPSQLIYVKPLAMNKAEADEKLKQGTPKSLWVGAG